MNVCTQCNLPCQETTIHWREKDEFWNAPCWRDFYEVVSECCEAEITEMEEATE